MTISKYELALGEIHLVQRVLKTGVIRELSQLVGMEANLDAMMTQFEEMKNRYAELREKEIGK